MSRELIKSCKEAIAKGRCLGCTALQDPNFTGNANCKFGQLPTAKQSIEQIKLNLGIKEQTKKW